MEEIKEKSCGIIPFMIIDGNVNFLIVKHNLGHWGFPKGHIEKGETEEQTARRELMEETGIKNVRIIDKCRFVEKYNIVVNGRNVIKTVILFLGEIYIDNPSAICIMKSELTDYFIGGYDNVHKLITYDSLRKLLNKIFYFLMHNRNG